MKIIDAFDKRFATEESCKEYLVEKRWPKRRALSPL